MSKIIPNLENELLETPAGRAVYDALVQANVNLNTVSHRQIREMLMAELQSGYSGTASTGCEGIALLC